MAIADSAFDLLVVAGTKKITITIFFTSNLQFQHQEKYLMNNIDAVESTTV
jgi:hypothetical protein